MILNADIKVLTEYVRQSLNEDLRGSRTGFADGSSAPSSATPAPLPVRSSDDSTPLPSIKVSDVNIQDGAFNYISADVDAFNEGEGTQNIWASNTSSGVDGNVHMNSPVSRSLSRSRSRSRSRGSSRSRSPSRSPNPSFVPSTDQRRRNVRVSPSPSIVGLPEEVDHMHEPLQDSPPLSSPHQSTQAPPCANSRSTSISGIKINNGAFNHVNSACKVTNKGSGTQTFHGPNIATNVAGNVSMNSGNVKTITTSNSNNDYSTHHHHSRSGELEFTL